MSPVEPDEERRVRVHMHARASFLSGVDDAGWCQRVWDAYVSDSVARGFARAEERAAGDDDGDEQLEEDDADDQEVAGEDERTPVAVPANGRSPDHGPAAVSRAAAAGSRGAPNEEKEIGMKKRGARLDAVEAAYRKHGNDSEAIAAETGRSAANVRGAIAILRKKGRLDGAPPTDKSDSGSPPRPRVSRASSRTSAPAGLEGVVEDLRGRRDELAAALERIDRALAALGAD